MSSSPGPRAPDDFVAPEPQVARVAPDVAAKIARGGVALLLRAGAGAVTAGYRVKLDGSRLVEYSASLPEGRPAEPLVLYAFPACPFCRKVYEALSALDLDVLVKPCPKGGLVYRPYVVETFGKSQFPYLYDPNTEFSSYESATIIKYLFQTYGGTDASVPLGLGSAGTLTAGLATLASGGRGASREVSVVTAPEPLRVWGYEPSPFCRIVFERLSELEIPYLWSTTPRGSPTRAALKELTGRVQVPYLEDPNTGVKMFESSDMLKYLDATYGPAAFGAKPEPTGEEIAAANAIGVAAAATMEVSAAADGEEDKDLSPPTEVSDPTLEEYCETAPDADECRTYDS